MILITGGGSGGHLSVAKSVLNECDKIGIKCIYIGSDNLHDKTWFENDERLNGAYFLKSTGFVDKKGIFNKIKVLFGLFSLIFQSIKIIKKHKITKVFSVGGYSSVAPCLAAILCFKKLYIHEQNSVFGLANKILKPFAKRTFCSFAPPYDAYPVQEKFFTNQTRDCLKKILFLGGSNGASFINDLALNIALTLYQNEVEIIHQCGKKDYEKCCEFYEKNGIDAKVFDFCDNIDEYMKSADLCISRAGASTISECVAANLPCIFIPYVYAYKNHQYYNAKFLVDKNLAFMVEQKNIKTIEISKLIFTINIKEISTRLSHIEKKNGAIDIAKALG